MLVIANCDYKDRLQSFRSLDCSNLAVWVRDRLDLPVPLANKLMDALRDNYLVSELKVNLALSSSTESTQLVWGLNLQEALILKSQVPEAAILAPVPVVPSLEGIVWFTDPGDLFHKVKALVD